MTGVHVCVSHVALANPVVPHGGHPIPPQRLGGVGGYTFAACMHCAEVDHGGADPLGRSQLVQADGFRGVFQRSLANLVAIREAPLRDARVAA